MKELEYPFDSEYILKKRIKIKKQLLNNKEIKFTKKKIAILGGSTTHEIMNMLELFLLSFGIMPEFYESAYNRYYEEGMFHNPALEEFEPDIIYIHTSIRNITEWPEISATQEQIDIMQKKLFRQFESLWTHLDETYHCSIIQNNFEAPFYRLFGNQDACYPQGKVNYVSKLNIMFYEYAQNHKNFYIHDINYESSYYGLEKWSNPFYWYMYKYAMALPAIPYTSHGIALIVKSIFGKNKKALSIDLDNTIWGGTIGDDGVENIEIGQETSLGQAYSEFQSYLKQLKQIGVLLTVNSKNNIEIAKEGFQREESVLRENDFSDFKANWEDKSSNLLDTAQELQLLPESFVFLDDNPAEREIIRQGVPGVGIPEMTKVEQYIQSIDQSGFFEVTTLSNDDFNRTEMYQANAKRNQARAAFVNYDEYLNSLEMKGIIMPFQTSCMSRISQLTNKSNQFNLTTKRYTQTEIEKIANDPQYLTLYGKLKDKFGDNGIVSVIIGKIQDNNLHIDLWLMSCRVLKRNMEYAMMDELVKHVKKKGLCYIYGYYYPTQKNALVKDFYKKMGFNKIREDTMGNTQWEFVVPGKYVEKNKSIYIEREEM